MPGQGLAARTKGFLTGSRKAFEDERHSTAGSAFGHLGVLALVIAFMNTLVGVLFGAPLGILMFPVTYVGVILIMILAGLWLHVWVYAFGGRAGLPQTLKAIFYSFTSFYLLGWFPVVNVISILYSIYTLWIGTRILGGLPGNRSAWAVIVAFLIPAIIISITIIIAMSLFPGVLTRFGLPGNMIF